MDVILINVSGKNILMFPFQRCISNFCRNLMSDIRICDFTRLEGNDHMPGKVVSLLHHIVFSHLCSHTGANNSGKIANIPLLLIDDEADNASIDTKAAKRIGTTDVDPDASEQDPTKINGLIRQILNCFAQSAYVGYTATPFANIFIYPMDENNVGEIYGEDLYPRSFIVNLHAPSNYIGPEKVFGLYKDRTAGINEVMPLPLTRLADDYLTAFPEKHKKDQ